MIGIVHVLPKTLGALFALAVLGSLLPGPDRQTRLAFAESAEAEKANVAPRTMGEKIDDASDSLMLGSQKAFFEAIDKKSMLFRYNDGKSGLSTTDKRSLRTLIGAQGVAKEKAYIAGWGDASLSKDVSATDRENSENLAQRRIGAVQKSLKDAGFKGEVIGINMVTKPSSLSAVFGLESEEVKSALRTTSDDTTVGTQRIADVLEAKGGFGKSVVVLVREQ